MKPILLNIRILTTIDDLHAKLSDDSQIKGGSDNHGKTK
jgi:hypothetical protein